MKKILLLLTIVTLMSSCQKDLFEVKFNWEITASYYDNSGYNYFNTRFNGTEQEAEKLRTEAGNELQNSATLNNLCNLSNKWYNWKVIKTRL